MKGRIKKNKRKKVGREESCIYCALTDMYKGWIEC